MKEVVVKKRVPMEADEPCEKGWATPASTLKVPVKGQKPSNEKKDDGK